MPPADHGAYGIWAKGRFRGIGLSSAVVLVGYLENAKSADSSQCSMCM